MKPNKDRSKKENDVNLSKLLGVVLIVLNLLGCEKDCPCTAMEVTNFCLTANGSRTLPDTLTYVRESEGKANVFDTLETHSVSSCFGEVPGKHRVLVYSHDSLIFKSEWIILDAEGCCNHTKDTTIDLTL